MALISLVLAAALAGGVQAPTEADCSVDRKAMLALSFEAFDQDLQGGWRTLGEAKGCHAEAADLIAEYRRVHQPQEGNVLTWHEAQMRANAGQSAAAVPLMRQSLRGPDGEASGWNANVEGSIAFLERDNAALQRAVAKLAATPPPPGLDVKDGKFLITDPEGNSVEIRWPANLDVLQALQRCFDTPYLQAMQTCKQ
ncbi:hypothetical protein ICJ04_17055 [Stenotrophomonas sp. 169]|uniref:hypothetical protein n=1 Tax=Stenotrophomonas sp. 169 TaxID=2770322 RepID=UPI00166229AF|nr:hypothetical protein [Stenotrophomonas sp. 169]QNR97161.1 hypothetical protein ICJ04_17055 [Stenotrophomonas sp. 169]